MTLALSLGSVRGESEVPGPRSRRNRSLYSRLLSVPRDLPILWPGGCRGGSPRRGKAGASPRGLPATPERAGRRRYAPHAAAGA